MVEVQDKKAAQLAKRRAYYAKNWSHIRERDNENARTKRAENPEKYQVYSDRHKAKAAENPVTFSAPLTIEGHPDKDKIICKIILDLGILPRNGVEVGA